MPQLLCHSLALVLLAAVTGCAADCASLCEDRKQCPGASPDERARDCDTSCQTDKAREDRFGCSSQNDDLVSCLGGLDDLCDPPPDACSAELAKLYQCRRVYCAAHPDDAYCAE